MPRRRPWRRSRPFRAAFQSRPCLVPADGFYEWKKLAQKNQLGDKQPWYITTKDKAPFAFAGLWDFWRAKDAAKQDPGLQTFTILTCEPSALCAPLHDRMPVMLARENWSAWLGAPEQRTALMRPFPAERMTCWPVGKAVGNVKNQGAELVLPIKAA